MNMLFQLSRPVKALLGVVFIIPFAIAGQPLRAQDQKTSPETAAASAKLNEPVLVGDTLVQQEIVVTGEANYEGRVQPVFFSPVEGTSIYSGKKATRIDLDTVPQVVGNDYRQALSTTPGILLSEETSPLVSLGYRGIGEPHRAQFFNVLKDGIPIHADPFGYPEAYYTPPLDVVDHIDFIRGGASLMYGPQPAGALNYVTNMPRVDKPFSLRTQHVFGSDDLYSTYNSFDGTVGRVGYLGYFNHRSSQGFRDSNSDYELNGGSIKVVIDGQTDSRWIFNMDAYEEEHGEPGELTYAQYIANRDQTPRPDDEFRLRRYIPSLAFEHDFSEDTQVTVKGWGGYYQRWSGRQTGAQRNIENQEFYTFGTEARVRHNYDLWDNQHTFAGGFQVYANHSPRTDTRGATPTSEDGILFSDSERNLVYGSFFFENKFTFDKFSITPGFRLENVSQDVTTDAFNPGTGVFTGRRQNDKIDVQPLVALSSAYQATETTELYASVAQSYRSTIFTETIVAPVGNTVNGDINPAVSWTYETGYRGSHRDWFTYDTSLFFIDLDDKYGVVGANIQNVGRSLNYGWDAAVDFDPVKLYDDVNQTDFAERFGSVGLYGNVSLLEAEIDGGIADGNSPQYAPDYIVRVGGIYRLRDRIKVGLLGTFVGDHFAKDVNVAASTVPSYMVWDLTAEAKIYKDYVSLVAGIKNLLDEDYYTRIRGGTNLIDPSYGRNYYAGFRLEY
jgi:Fe(3+) dicitrate transport protein